MPLADRIVDAVGSLGADISGIPEVAERILEAERFVFDLEAKAAIVQIAESKPSALLTALPLCRLPFSKCWFEWPGEWVGGKPDVSPESTETPRTFGVLLEAVDSTHQRFSASFVWDFKPHGAVEHLFKLSGHTINVCTVALRVDWADWEDFTEIRVANEAEAASAIQATLTSFVPPHARGLITTLRETNPAAVQEFVESNLEDIRGEICYVIAALCLLNTKNYVNTQQADLAKINKARVRNRKAPRMSYSTVKIRLSRHERTASQAIGMTREEMRRHVVRGHFKIRRSGIYWWRPFVRGSHAAGEVRRSSYEVVH